VVSAHADALAHAKIVQLACKLDDREAARGDGPDVVCFDGPLSAEEHQVIVEINAVGVGGQAEGFNFKLRSHASFTPNAGEKAEVIAHAVEREGPIDLTELAKFLHIRVDLVNPTTRKTDVRAIEVEQLAQYGDCAEAMQRAREYLRSLGPDEADDEDARDAYATYLACDDALYEASR